MFANHRMPVLIFTKRLLVHFIAQKTDIIVDAKIYIYCFTYCG